MQGFMITLLTCSVTMSALALLYMLAMPLLAKRYSEKGRYYAWLVIVVGLIIPFRPQWGNAIVKMEIANEVIAPMIQVGNRTPLTVPITAPINNSVGSPASFDFSWWQIAVVVWLVGVIVFLAYHAVKHFRFVKMTKRWSESVTDEQSLATLRNLKEKMGITKQIELNFCSCVGSPMMIGLIKPRIFLPAKEIAHDELRFILKHELVHYKRKDLLYKYLVLIATALHWFNPIVYLMAKAIAALCEMSCDTAVVQDMDAGTRQTYSEAIIGVAKYQSKLKTVLSTNFYGGKKGMKNRITSIMDMSNKKAGIVIICMALIITLGTGAVFAANAVTNPSPSQDSEISLATVSSDIFETYRDFGLVYDSNANELYYHGEIVRYFEDLIPLTYVAEDATYGITHFSENGSVDIYTVRDFSVVVHNPNGTTDHSGVLLGVEKLSQVEFDARDIDMLRNRSSIAHADISADFDGEYLHIGNYGVTTTVRGASTDDHAQYSQTTVSLEANAVFDANMPDVHYSNSSTVIFAEYEAWGLSIEGLSPNPNGGFTATSILNVFYQGNLIRGFSDFGTVVNMSISSADLSGNGWLNVIRDENGSMTGVNIVN